MFYLDFACHGVTTDSSLKQFLSLKNKNDKEIDYTVKMTGNP